MTAASGVTTIEVRSCAPVAQLDRAFASGAKGRWFESTRAYHILQDLRFRAAVINRLSGFQEYTGVVFGSGSSPFVSMNGHTFVRFRGDAPTVIDCGANEGSFSKQILARWPEAKVDAVEASPRLAANLSALPFAKLHCAALSGAAGFVEFHLNGNSEASSIEGRLSGHLETVRVAAVSLPSVIAGKERINLIKLDVEGAEIQALNATPDNRFDAIDQLSIEFHEFMFPEHAVKITEVSARLCGLGFTRLNFSWPNTDNVLFVRADRFGLSWADVWMARAKRAYWYLFRRPSN